MAAKQLTASQRSAVERAKRSENLRPILFRKATGLEWFEVFQEAGFVRPEDFPAPVPSKEEGYVTIPVWPITDYLVNASVELGVPENAQHAEGFLDFIRKATRLAESRGISNYRVWWQFAKVVHRLPPKFLSINDVELADYWLNDPYERGLVAEALGDWLLTLLQAGDVHGNRLALELLKTLYKLQFVTRTVGTLEKREVKLRFDAWHARNLSDKTTKGVVAALGGQAVLFFQGKLEELLKEEGNDKWSCVWRPAIEEHTQNHGRDDVESVVLEMYRDSVLTLLDKSPNAGNEHVAAALKTTLETLQRVAIYAIDQRFSQLGHLVVELTDELYFKRSNFRHELWHLLHRHYPWFKRDVQDQVRDTIINLKQTDDVGQPHEGATAYLRSIWLTALKDFSNELSELYDRSVAVTGRAPEHPDFASYVSVGWVEHKTPITEETLLSLSATELVTTLNGYKGPERRQGFDEVGLEGLAKAVRRVIKRAPLKFYADLRHLANLDLLYVHEVIEGYSELWTEKAQLPWTDVLTHLFGFIGEVIKQPRFWASDKPHPSEPFIANPHWIVSAIARLIENGMRADEHAFPEKFLDDAESIVLVLLDNEPSEEFKTESDAMVVAINSPRGRCLEALINLALRRARIEQRETDQHELTWKRYASIFDRELRAPKAYEFATLVVSYLQNFLYLSRGWVLENLRSIFNTSDYMRWLCAMQGYAYVGIVYEPIYDFLKKEGHFLRALNNENLKDRIRDKVIQNIGVAYLHGFEQLSEEGSLIGTIIDRQNPNELRQLIWFMWTLRGSKENLEDTRTKIFALWEEILAKANASTREGRATLSHLSSWIAFVDIVDDKTRSLIAQVLPHAGDHHHSHDMLKGLAQISERQPMEAYALWKRLLEFAAPDYPPEDMKRALVNIASTGPDGVRNAKEIVSLYVQQGNEHALKFLEELPAVRQRKD
ncbi:MAG: hypothetical protein QOD26_3766 [Betaproteobacteria bacterium]|nr:hypothetical protein [Betaproteobacteria bacterium]